MERFLGRAALLLAAHIRLPLALALRRAWQYWADYYAATHGLVVLLALLAGENISDIYIYPFPVLSGLLLVQRLLVNQ